MQSEHVPFAGGLITRLPSLLAAVPSPIDPQCLPMWPYDLSSTTAGRGPVPGVLVDHAPADEQDQFTQEAPLIRQTVHTGSPTPGLPLNRLPHRLPNVKAARHLRSTII